MHHFSNNVTAKQSCQDPIASYEGPLSHVSKCVCGSGGGGSWRGEGGRRRNVTTTQTSVKLLPPLLKVLNNSFIPERDTPWCMCVYMCKCVASCGISVKLEDAVKRHSMTPGLQPSHYSHFNQIGAALVTLSTSTCNNLNANRSLD